VSVREWDEDVCEGGLNVEHVHLVGVADEAREGKREWDEDVKMCAREERKVKPK
jgi:hypothetical protein